MTDIKRAMARTGMEALSYAAADQIAPLIGRGIDFAGDKLGKYFSGTKSAVRDATLSGLTDLATGGRSSDSSKYKGSIGDPFQDDKGKWVARMPKKEGSYPGIFGPAYRNPEVTADILGNLAPAAGLTAAGLGIGWLAGGKPRSAYALPVDNPNIQASNASYQNQALLEQQKFEHRMMLERAREQSRVPGPQNIDQGGYGGVDPYKRSPSSAFSDADMLGIARGIYGSGMRL